ncbi:MAG: S9 family peptidase [Anaerolineales bacterium]|nr:S9 family peptidase [Anaerolineales bacterium]
MIKNMIRRQYGLWDSPISPHKMAQGISFANVEWDQSGALVWLENRGNRGAIVVQPGDGSAPRDLTADLAVRARVGYGGGDFTVGLGRVYYVAADSGRVYRQNLQAGLPQAVTPAFGQAASPALSPDGRWLVFVHSYEDQDCLAIVDSEGSGWPAKLVAGADFYMQPAWHPNAKTLAWVDWNHPNMPWDGTFLRVATLQVPAENHQASLPMVTDIATIAGDEQTSIFQPQFSPDGRYLAFCSDASSWWQIILHDIASGAQRQITHVAAEHGAPAWVQGMRKFSFNSDGSHIYFIRNDQGVESLWQLAVDSGEEFRLPLDPAYTCLEQIALWGERDTESLAFAVSGGKRPGRIVSFQPGGRERIWRRATSEELPEDTFSQPECIAWTAMDGEQAFGLFYAPHNSRFEGKGKPPLIVSIHGGPTSQAQNEFSMRDQFFTSRGYAVLEVNYRGSTGYGREYRNKLRGQWGIYDVQDAVSGAQYLVDSGKADGSRLVIIGGSAGGYTVLKALEDYPGFFKAGICLYGISNQFTAAVETHKFEVHYNDMLLGELPEAAEVYRQRSPLFFAEKIKDPVALFQGEDDQVVRRNQSDEMVAVLQKRGVPYIYHVYPGEGHGFRKSETLMHYYETVEKFLREFVLFA